MIKIVKLASGEDVIAQIEKKGDSVTLKSPHRLILSQQGLGSMPLCPFSKSSDYVVNAQNIIFECEPDDEISESYANQVGAILVPTKGIVTP